MNTRRKLFYLVCIWAISLAPLASAQSISWTHQFGTTSDDFAFGVAIDSTGIYSAGYTGKPTSPLVCQSSVGGSDSDSFVRVYDPVNNIDTTLATGNPEVARSVAVYAGGVYSAGLNQQAGNAVVRKADPGGWTDTAFPNPSQAYAVAVNGTGVYAAGFTSVGTDIQAFVRKYDFNGNFQWDEIFGTASVDVAIGLTLNGTSLYVTGYTAGALGGPTAGGGDVFVRKYDISGAAPVASWTTQFGTTANDAAFSAASDATGVYLAGCTGGTPGGDVCASNADAFVRKLNPDGSNAWFSQFGTALSFDSALGVAVNGSGVYVSGYTDGQLPGQTALGNSDAFLAKYSLTGAPLWTHQFGTSAADLAWGVAADPSGAVVVGCTAGTLPGQTSSGGSDAYIAKNPPGPASTVGIDIRPGASPNNINLGSSGVVQVAILSSATFDATTVDPMTVTLAGASVKLKGNGTPQTIQQDVNGDGRMDLIVQVSTSALQLSSTDTTATLTGLTFAGEAFQGTDLVRIVP